MTTPEAQPTSTEEFSITDWLMGAKLPEESVTLYQRADLVAEIQDLERRIEVESKAAEADRINEDSLGSRSPVRALQDELQALLEQFAGSKLTVYVRALPGPERKALRKDSEAAEEDAVAFGYRALSKAIVAVKGPDGIRKPVHMERGHLEQLELRIGSPQMKLLLDAYRMATNGIPTVSADFLPATSGSTGQNQK